MKYSVTVTNTNGSTCAASSFNLSAAVPNGWSSSFSPATLSLSPGARASAALTLSAFVQRNRIGYIRFTPGNFTI
jgi:hypothetical protein